MTLRGFDVLVQLVMAAITTPPSGMGPPASGSSRFPVGRATFISASFVSGTL
jgi:hypothetical protein